MHFFNALVDQHPKATVHNQGPVTFTIDSRKFEYVDQPASGTSTPKGKGKGTATPKNTKNEAKAVAPKSEGPDAGAKKETNSS